jgi:hypothetical protein
MLTHFYEVIDIGKQGRISLIGEDDYVRAAKGASRNILGQKLNPPRNRTSTAILSMHKRSMGSAG